MNPVQRFVDAINSGDIDALAATCHPDFEMIVPQHPDRGFKGREQEVKNMAHLMSTYPEARLHVVKMDEVGDDVWLEAFYQGGGLHVAAAVRFHIDRESDTILYGRYYSEQVDESGQEINDWVSGLGSKGA